VVLPKSYPKDIDIEHGMSVVKISLHPLFTQDARVVCVVLTHCLSHSHRLHFTEEHERQGSLFASFASFNVTPVLETVRTGCPVALVLMTREDSGLDNILQTDTLYS
jgi:hypothetical protein